MSCEDDAAYVLGALPPAERAAYERHLATCERCQTRIRELAGLPSLLALAGEGALGLPEPAAEVGPSDLLWPRLAAVVRRRRRRRVAALVAAVAVTLASASAAVVLALRPAPAVSAPPPASQSLSLSAAADEPMAATVDLFDRQWGTSITVHCRSDGPHESGVPYQLVVVDQQQRSTAVGSWTSIPGAASTITAATALHRAQMVAVQIKDSDGEVVLTAPVH